MSTIYPCQIALNSLFGDVSIFPILFANCIVLTVRDGDTVKHYRIRQLDEGGFFISRRTTFRTLQELVEHYSADADGLCVNLRKPCIQVSIFSNARPQLNIIICLLLGTAFPPNVLIPSIFVLEIDWETSDSGNVVQYSWPVGDWPDIAQICAQIRSWTVRWSLGGTLEQHHTRCH